MSSWKGLALLLVASALNLSQAAACSAQAEAEPAANEQVKITWSAQGQLPPEIEREFQLYADWIYAEYQDRARSAKDWADAVKAEWDSSAGRHIRKRIQWYYGKVKKNPALAPLAVTGLAIEIVITPMNAGDENNPDLVAEMEGKNQCQGPASEPKQLSSNAPHEQPHRLDGRSEPRGFEFHRIKDFPLRQEPMRSESAQQGHPQTAGEIGVASRTNHKSNR